jgi:predicted RNA-binding protein with PIN domain
MAKRYLIDGNNVLYAARSHGPARSMGRDVLCRLLAQWACQRGIENVTVVFDGPVPRGDLARQMQQPGLTVRFSGSNTADAVIEDEVARATAPADITVVTTDRAIQHAVRYRRASCIDSEQFVAQLSAEPATTTAPAPTEPEKPNEVSAEEARKLLEELGPDLPDVVDDLDRMG